MSSTGRLPAVKWLPWHRVKRKVPRAPSIAPVDLTRVTEGHVRWAFRLLLDREVGVQEIAAWVAANPTTADLRRAILLSEEFRSSQGALMPPVAQRLVVIAEITSRLRLCIDLADAAVGRQVLIGGYEPEETRWALSQLAPGDTAIDVGANIGYFTVLFADRVGATGHVIAFEPCRHVAELLARSIAENRFEKRVSLRPAAVGDVPGEMQLAFLSPELGTNSGGSYLLPSKATAPAGHSIMPVSVVTLDEEELPGRVALLKIDAEGAEPLVLKGARGLLQRDRPKILAELNPIALRRLGSVDPVTQLLALTQAAGYRAFVLKTRGHLVPIERTLNSDSISSLILLPAD